MSVTFRAILNSGISIETRQELPNRLAQTTIQISSSLKKLGLDPKRIRNATWKWVWNSDLDGDFQSWLVRPFVEIFFDEPPIIALGLNTRVSVINLMVDWISFTNNAEVQEEVRSVIQCFGRCLCADSAIYLPDSGWRAAEKAVESIRKCADFEAASTTFITEMRLKSSFSNLPREIEEEVQVKRVKAFCSAWPVFFDRWEMTKK